MKNSRFALLSFAVLLCITTALLRANQDSDESFAEWRKADATLNETYNKLLATLDEPGKAKLRDAQRAWIKFCDAECEFAADANRGGSMARLDYAECEKELTEARTAQLAADMPVPTTEPAATQPTGGVTKVGMDEAYDAPKRLSDSVILRCRLGENGGATATLTCGKTKCDIEFTRWGEFYCFASEPEVVIIFDAFVSNEDRLIVYDFRQSPVKPITIGHKDFDYIHQHFDIKSAADGTLQMEEQEWAGDNPPRDRSVSLTVGADAIKISRGKWHAD